MAARTVRSGFGLAFGVLVPLLFGLSLAPPAHAAKASEARPASLCAAACVEHSVALHEECVAAGQPERECAVRAMAARSVCLLERCEPGRPDCEQRCAARAKAFFVRCNLAGEDTEACRERAEGVRAACVEEHCESCVCPDVFDPVCGADGVTYGNACEARCAGVRIAHEGECDGRLCRSDEDCEPGSLCRHKDCDAPCLDAAVCTDRCVGVCVDCICPDVWDPVCGVDGETYGNRCEARCAGVEVKHEGECVKPCVCPRVLDPVCGVDGTTYPNECLAKCAEVEVAHPGRCREICEQCRSTADCPLGQVCDPVLNACVPGGACARLGFTPETCPLVRCAAEGDPVCGVDGETYPNACRACCGAGVEIAHPGRCEQVCICPHVYMPVCGVDGVTYGNACEARCAGVEIAHEGACREGCRDNSDCPERQICYPPTKQCQAPCEIQCFRYDPVCGTDGVTYACGGADAACHGVEVAHEGECGICYGDQDCSEGTRCNAADICLPPPGCEDPGTACPAVCTGHCVSAI